MNRSWLLLTLPAAVVGVAVLAWAVRSLIRTLRGAVVLSVLALIASGALFIGSLVATGLILSGPRGS